MKRIAIALLTGAALAVSLLQGASAAELPVRAAPPPPPPPPPPPIWTGWYLGVHGGAAWMSTPTWNVTDPTGTLASQSFTGNTTLGAVGGLQGGYNWQVLPAWVLGVEGDISWTSLQSQITNQPLLRANGASVCPSTPGVIPITNSCGTQMSQNERWLASVRGKVGFTGWWNNTMLYATGGIAWANAEYTAQTLTGPFSAVQNFQSNTSITTTNTGWVAGGGAEWQATTNILLRAEYLYYRINGGQTSSATFVPVPGTIATAVAPIGYSWSSYNVQVARVAVSYKF
jgi:outer membrane immunogenic protein